MKTTTSTTTDERIDATPTHEHKHDKQQDGCCGKHKGQHAQNPANYVIKGRWVGTFLVRMGLFAYLITHLVGEQNKKDQAPVNHPDGQRVKKPHLKHLLLLHTSSEKPLKPQYHNPILSPTSYNADS